MGKSFHDCNLMREFQYEFFMQLILSVNLSEYEIKKHLLTYSVNFTNNKLTLSYMLHIPFQVFQTEYANVGNLAG